MNEQKVDLVRIIGEKEVELKALRQQITALMEQVKQQQADFKQALMKQNPDPAEAG